MSRGQAPHVQVGEAHNSRFPDTAAIPRIPRDRLSAAHRNMGRERRVLGEEFRRTSEKGTGAGSEMRFFVSLQLTAVFPPLHKSRRFSQKSGIRPIARNVLQPDQFSYPCTDLFPTSSPRLFSLCLPVTGPPPTRRNQRRCGWAG